MKWFRYIEFAGLILLIICLTNFMMTDYTTGVLIYNGFIPQSILIHTLVFTGIILIVGYFLELIYRINEFWSKK